MRTQLRLPTLFGLLVLVVGIAAGVFLVQRAQLFSLRASPEETPKQVKITNITDRSFSVSWTTDKEVLGFIVYGKSPSLGSTVRNSTTPSSTHLVKVESLSANTKYLFKIGSGGGQYDNNGQPYEITTASPGTGTPSSEVIFGTVENAQGSPATGALVYVSIPGVSPLSSITDNQGNWTIPLAIARATDLTRYANPDPTTPTQITVQGSRGEIAQATILIGAARPVPPIKLGQSHDFTNLKPVESSSVPASNLEVPEEFELQQESTTSGFDVQDVGSPVTETNTVTLSSPEEKEKVYTAKPQFVGKGTPGTTLSITVESSHVYSDEVTVDESGSWSWSPPGSLSPGEHTATISWRDERGNERSIIRSFTILAAGQNDDLPSFTASPSGQTATPSPSPTPSPRVTIPSTESGVPVSGNLTQTLALFIMGVGLLLSGIFLPRVLKT